MALNEKFWHLLWKPNTSRLGESMGFIYWHDACFDLGIESETAIGKNYHIK